MPAPLNVLLIPMGSAGDVHPLVGLGAAMRRRGHRVTVLVNEYFGPLVRRAGLDHVALGEAAEFRRTLNNPDLWHPIRGFETVVKQALLPSLRPVYDFIAERLEPGRTVVAAASLAMGARVAREKFDFPLATIHLQPGVFQSVIAPPKLPGLYMPAWSPAWMRRATWRMVNAMVDRLVGPGVNAFRRAAGVGGPPARQLFNRYWNSPDRILGLFPDWFAPIQPDWPPGIVLTGFPLYDEADVTPAAEPLRAFLDAGEPPIVFTPGSAMVHGHDFFAASIEAAGLLNRRAVLLTKFPEQLPVLPDRLPPGVRHFDYAPFSAVFPRAAAVVHHGGVGTTAQGLAAGVPQLLMAMAHDQFDNAARVERLGVGTAIRRKDYRAAKVAEKINAMIRSERVNAACKAVAARFVGAQPLERACDELERLGGAEPGQPASVALAATNVAR